MRHVCTTTVAVEKQYYIFWVCVCSISCPACKVHVPYYFVICSLSRYTIFFPHYFINNTISGEKKLLNIKYVFCIPYKFVRKTYNSKNNSVRYYHKCPKVFMWSDLLFLSDFNRILICRQFFFFLCKTQISNFMKICPVGAELFRAGGRTDMTKLMVNFRNFANAPKHQCVNDSYKHNRCLFWDAYTV